jgi:hypothetical protein
MMLKKAVESDVVEPMGQSPEVTGENHFGVSSAIRH